MEIPKYILSSVYAHLKRIADNAEAQPDDHRTKDALRLARKDLVKLEKYIKC